MSVDFADLKPSLLNAFMFLLTAMLVIPVGKFALIQLSAMFPMLSGFRDLAAAI